MIGLLEASWRVLLLGLVPASVFGPVACGLVIVYRSSGVLNFAQGAFAFVGGYFFFVAANSLHLPFAAAVIAALLATFVCGLLVHWLLIRPIIGQNPVIVVMLTIGLSSVLEAIALLIFGTNQRFLHRPLGNKNVHIPGGVVISWFDLLVVVVSAAILISLACALRYTRAGLAIRAVSDSALLAGYWGQNAGRVVGFTWGISFALSTVAGITYALRSVLDSGVLSLGTLIFPAVIIGGMDSLVGAIVGSVMLGVATEAVTLYAGGQWSNFVVYVALLGVLAWRPFGLFGTRELARL